MFDIARFAQLAGPRSIVYGTFLLVLGASLYVRQVAEAQAVAEAPNVTLRAEAGVGVGSHQSLLPGDNGDRRLEPVRVPVLGLQIALTHALPARLQVGGEVDYASSLGYTVAHALPPATSEQSTARKQELALFGSVGLMLGRWQAAPTLALLAGYGLTAFTTETSLVAVPRYAVSGPRAGLELSWRWPQVRLGLSARGELGANLTASSGLRTAGVRAFGPSHAFQVQAEVQLTPAWSLGVRVREAHVNLPASSSMRFDDVHRFGVAYVSLRAGS